MKTLLKNVKTGMHLFHENDRSRELYLIQSGTIKVYRMSNGREIELATLGKGSVLGEMALIDGKPRSASAKALTDSVVILIDAEAFHDRIKDVPPWFMSIIKMTTHKIRQANLRLQNIRSAHQGANVAISLFYLFGHFDSQKEGLDLKTVQSRLISLLGLTHQKIAQTLDFLHKNDFIKITEESVFVSDFIKYKEYCEFLRLFIRNSFDKIHPLSLELTKIIIAIKTEYPAIIQNDDTVTEITGELFMKSIEKSGNTEFNSDILDFFRDLNLLSFTKDYSGKKPTRINGFKIKINNSEWKRIYLHTLYCQYEPIL